MYEYTQDNAKTYGTLGIQGTTYQPGFDEVKNIFGDLRGKVALDFGTGAGRTARLLRALGAKKVVGIDHNQTMIDQAASAHEEGLEFIKVGKDLPFDEGTFDVALAAHVLVEVSSIEEMRQISREVCRVLKPGGVFIIVANNSQAIGNDYLSFSYPKPSQKLISGEKIPCTIKKGEESFVIDDYYWSEDDYKDVLEEAGFTVSMTFPKTSGEGWLDEANVAPHVVVKAVK